MCWSIITFFPSLVATAVLRFPPASVPTHRMEQQEGALHDASLVLIAEYLELSGYPQTLEKLAAHNALDERFLSCPTMQSRQGERMPQKREGASGRGED